MPLLATALLAALPLAPAHGQALSPVPRETRLERDQQALRDRIARLESSGRHAALLESVATLRRNKQEGGALDQEGWALALHELNVVHSLNHPDAPGPEAPIRALDFERENHPVKVIPEYARQLARHDIELLVVPVPSRVQVWSDRLPGMSPAEGAPGGDLGTARLLLALSEAGVEVVDLLPAFAADRARFPDDADHRLYRNYNPHWSPRGVSLAADVLAERVRQMEWFEPGPDREDVDFFLRRESLEHELGGVPDDPPTFFFERVLDAADRPVPQREQDSPILLLGDSFSAVYASQGAGIANQLHARLGHRLDRISVAGGGASSAWQSVARRPDGLSGKRLVIWVFTIGVLDDPALRSVEIILD